MKMETLDTFIDYIKENAGENSIEIDLYLVYINGKFIIKYWKTSKPQGCEYPDYRKKYMGDWNVVCDKQKNFDDLPKDLFVL